MAKRQKFLKSCGAAGLINAAWQLGTLRPDQATDELEGELYDYSSGRTADGYSLPSGLVDACHYLHHVLWLKVAKVTFDPDLMPRQVKDMVPLQKAQLLGVNVSVEEEGATGRWDKVGLYQTRAELFVVAWPSGLLHWLLRTGPRTFVDPVDGQTHAWFAGATPQHNGYKDVGITAFLERSTVPGQPCTPGMRMQPSVAHTTIGKGSAWA